MTEKGATKPVCRKEDELEHEQSPHSAAREHRPASSKRASSTGSQLTPRLHAKATIARAKMLIEKVRKLFETRAASETADADVSRGFDDILDPYMLAGVEQNAVKEGTRTVHED